jgi:hypothetical protein
MQERVCSALADINFNPFNLYIGGLQINRDGCVVLRGYDQFQSIFRIRDQLKKTINFFPEQQSGWAHIPIGRILNPIGINNFIKLREFCYKNRCINLHNELIVDAKFVHEKQWYMEQHQVLLKIT